MVGMGSVDNAAWWLWQQQDSAAHTQQADMHHIVVGMAPIGQHVNQPLQHGMCALAAMLVTATACKGSIC